MTKARDLADGTFSGAFSADSPTLVVDDTNNRVGVGTASPSAPLQIAADSNTLSLRISGRSADDRSDIQFYENDNTTKLTSLTNEQTYSLWSYGTRSIYTDSDTHIFRNGSATTLARIDSDGLKFNGDTAAANALDDYEEGTFTAAMSGSGGGSFTVGSNSRSYYKKVGGLVTVNTMIQWSANSATGPLRVTGLPFAAVNTDSYYRTGVAIGYVSGADVDGANFRQLVGTMSGGGTQVDFFLLQDNAAPTTSDASLWSSSGELQFGVTYMTNS